MSRKKYTCEYCGKPMSEYDYKEYKGICKKCREVHDWKEILKHVKKP